MWNVCVWFVGMRVLGGMIRRLLILLFLIESLVVFGFRVLMFIFIGIGLVLLFWIEMFVIMFWLVVFRLSDMGVMVVVWIGKMKVVVRSDVNV